MNRHELYELHTGRYVGPATDVDLAAFEWWSQAGRRGYLIRGGVPVVVKEVVL